MLFSTVNAQFLPSLMVKDTRNSENIITTGPHLYLYKRIIAILLHAFSMVGSYFILFFFFPSFPLFSALIWTNIKYPSQLNCLIVTHCTLCIVVCRVEISSQLPSNQCTILIDSTCIIVFSPLYGKWKENWTIRHFV